MLDSEMYSAWRNPSYTTLLLDKSSIQLTIVALSRKCKMLCEKLSPSLVTLFIPFRIKKLFIWWIFKISFKSVFVSIKLILFHILFDFLNSEEPL